MLTVLEEVLDRCQSDQKRKGEPQLSMWADNRKGQEEIYPEIDEFPEKQLMAFEKETIGFYISRHPLSSYQIAMKRVTPDDTSTLSAHQTGEEVKICGLVSAVKEIVTKKGDRMAFLTLEDLKGFVEVILFPEVFKAASSILRGGDPVLVRGTLDLSEDHVKIKAMEVQALPEASLLAPKTLRLRIPVSSLTPSRLEDLRAAIVDHRGEIKVFLHLTNGIERETIIALSDEYAVDPSPQFQNQIHMLFQPSRISFE